MTTGDGRPGLVAQEIEPVSAYRGHLTTVVGDGPEVVIKLSGQWVRVLTPDGKVHTWPSADVRVTGISGDRFWLAFDGEIAVFAPEEPDAFILEFLPGLKAARTVADALAAASPQVRLPGDDDRLSWTPGEGPRVDHDVADAPVPAPVSAPADTGEAQVAPPNGASPPRDPVIRRISDRNPRLPQLAQHIASSRNGDAPEIATEPAPPGPGPIPIGSCDHDWEPEDRSMNRCVRCGVRELIADRLPGPKPEPIEVDLTDSGLLAVSEDEDQDTDQDEEPESGTEDDSGLVETAPAASNLLRTLANRHQRFEAEHRGSYRPKR